VRVQEVTRSTLRLVFRYQISVRCLQLIRWTNQWIITPLQHLQESRDSSVGIGAGYVLDNLFDTATRPALGSTQPPIKWISEALSLGVKQPGREADHSPPSSAEVENAWSCTSSPPICLHGVVLSEAQGQLYLFTFDKLRLFVTYVAIQTRSQCFLLLIIHEVNRRCSFHGLGSLVYSFSQLTTGTTNPFKNFDRTPWMGDRLIAKPLPTEKRADIHSYPEWDSN